MSETQAQAQTYTYQQVRDASCEYFHGDELAADVFAGKYALQDLKGVFFEQSPADMHRRLAKEFARIEAKYPNPMDEETIYQLLSSWMVVPQGSPMSGIGNPFQVQSISNCFVIKNPEDSYGGIFRADQELAQIAKRRGGVGFDVSEIRPRGLPAANAARTTDGVGVFMDRFSNTTREVAQGGRRGALMLTISVHHPEIETFIAIKKDRSRVTGANISIRITDEFMEAVKRDEKYQQRWPVNSANPKISNYTSARAIWKQIMDAAWDSAEPGVLFWDTLVRGSPADCYSGYESTSTNPCSELPLSPYDSCRLLLLNLMKFVRNPYTWTASFDFETFYNVTEKAQRLMDDMVDLELETIDKILAKIETDPEPLEVRQVELNLWRKIRKATGDGRRTGLGVTGVGDCLAALGLKYGDPVAIQTTGEFYHVLALASYSSSIRMAKERGAFPAFDVQKEKDHPFILRVICSAGNYGELASDWMHYGRRNIANLTTSPAGSLSTLTQTTSGIEPAFKLHYRRRKKITASDLSARVDFVDAKGDRWQEYDVFHHGHLQWAQVNGKDPLLDLTQSPYFGACANDIAPEAKLRTISAAQMWVDHAISNTTNLPKETTVETVEKLYFRGWELGLKGVTVYRDGSRAGVLIDAEEKKPKEKAGDKRDAASITYNSAPKRPTSLPVDIHLVKIKGEQHLLLVGLLEEKPYEIFCGLAKEFDVTKAQKRGAVEKSKRGAYDLVVDGHTYADIVGTFDNPNYGAFTRTISTALRHGTPIQYLVEQLRKDKHSDMWSFSTVVARVLAKKYIPDGTKTTEKKCPACEGSNLAYQDGCSSCLDCGASKCG